MKKLNVKIKLTHPASVLPRYAKPGDAAMDLIAVRMETKGKYIEYETGVAVAIPEGYVGLCFPPSSVSNTVLHLCNSVGVIDSGYRGTIKFRYRRDMPGADLYNEGDKVGQLMIIPYPAIEWEQVDELDETERGTGGHGSTGR